MRREFILFMLGMICITTFSSLLSELLIIQIDDMLLDKVVGLVGAGNFSYWQLGHTGPILVELTSLSGDADLYIADRSRPSYEIDRNNFSSVTCGRDVINIPADFPRPIGIGVFGHWSHSVSEYSIQVFLEPSPLFSQEQYMAIESSQNGEDGKDAAVKKGEKDVQRKSDMEIKPRYSYILSFLEMIFEMLVL